MAEINGNQILIALINTAASSSTGSSGTTSPTRTGDNPIMSMLNLDDGEGNNFKIIDINANGAADFEQLGKLLSGDSSKDKTDSSTEANKSTDAQSQWKKMAEALKKLVDHLENVINNKTAKADEKSTSDSTAKKDNKDKDNPLANLSPDKMIQAFVMALVLSTLMKNGGGLNLPKSGSGSDSVLV